MCTFTKMGEKQEPLLSFAELVVKKCKELDEEERQKKLKKKDKKEKLYLKQKEIIYNALKTTKITYDEYTQAVCCVDVFPAADEFYSVVERINSEDLAGLDFRLEGCWELSCKDEDDCVETNVSFKYLKTNY